jgi:hypothetical protein
LACFVFPKLGGKREERGERERERQRRVGVRACVRESEIKEDVGREGKGIERERDSQRARMKVEE